MLTLLHLTFGTSAHIPDTLHEFYEGMFNVLVSRHDEMKPLYVREKATALSNSDLQTVFEHFCFLAKDHGVALSEEQFSDCAKRAAKLTSLSFTPEGLKTDLTEIVCLMLVDGLKIAFIHRSIQEFFTAFFLKHLEQEKKVKAIYERLAKSPLVWSQELRFLQQIDRYRYAEHYRLPIIEKFLKTIAHNSQSGARPSIRKRMF